MAIGDKDGFLAVLQQDISTVLVEQYNTKTMSIDAKLDDLQKELLRLANCKGEYIAVTDKICRLREAKLCTLAQNADRQAKRQRITDTLEFLDNQTGVISQYDDMLVRRLVERVTVFEGRVAIRFRSGVEVVVGV